MGINIYLETSIKRPARDWGAYAYVIEGVRAGEKETVSGSAHLPNTTFHQLAAIALSSALGRFNRNSSIKVYTDSTYLMFSIKNDRIRKWKQDGWKNAKGEDITDYPIWNKLLTSMIGHQLEFVRSTEHEYTERLQKLLDKEKSYRCI